MRIVLLAGVSFLGVVSVMPAAELGEVTIREVLPLNSREVASLRRVLAGHPEAAALLAEKKQEIQRQGIRPPAPLKEIRYEGFLNTDPGRISTVRHLEDMDRLASWLEVWQATGATDLAGRCREMILAWSGTYVPTGNDVNENKLMPVLVGYHDLRGTFSDEQREAVDEWVRNLAGKHHDFLEGRDGSNTNRFAKRLRIVALGGLILDRKAWVEAALEGGRRLITDGLYSDGTTHDLRFRDSLTYHTSTLRPILDLAVVSNTVDLYEWVSPTGGSLKKSVDYVLPFARGEEVHPEWVHSQAGIDHKRAEAGIPEYQPGIPYNPRRALRLLSEAELFDPSLRPLVAKLADKEGSRFPVWRIVVNEALRRCRD